MLRKPNSTNKTSSHDQSPLQSEESQSLLSHMTIPNQASAWYASNISISCQELLTLSQEHIKHGPCYKRNNSIFAYLLPCLYSKWKPRHLVVIGNYIYRFSDEYASKTKGVPIPLDSATLSRDRGSDEFILEIKTIRKSYQIRFDNGGELEEWYVFIKDRKARSIQERMGHAPISKEVRKYNQKSDALFNRVLYNDAREYGGGGMGENTSYSPMIGGERESR